MANKRISQGTLAAILRRRKKIEDLQTELGKLEDALLADLKGGAVVAAGILAARVKTWERRSVAWRQVCERELGKDYVERVFNATRPETHESLVVESV